MKIVVLVKEVPDTYGVRTLNLETGLADRAGGENLSDEIGERALEVALAYADAHEQADVSVLTMAPEGAVTSIRKCLAMGAATATHVVDPGLVGADLGLTAEVLAAALRRVGFDLVLAGNLSTDGMGGVVPAMLGELLDVPVLSNLSSVSITDDSVSGARASDEATVQVSATLPAIVAVTEALPDARFPNFKGIMAAKKKPFEVLTLADLGLDPEDLSAGRAIMLRIGERPARQAGVKITAEAGAEAVAAAQLADFLATNRLV